MALNFFKTISFATLLFFNPRVVFAEREAGRDLNNTSNNFNSTNDFTE